MLQRLCDAGLQALRKAMDDSLAKGSVERYPRRDDQFMLPFLRARKYNIEKGERDNPAFMGRSTCEPLLVA